jgi:hypothetical protein
MLAAATTRPALGLGRGGMAGLYHRLLGHGAPHVGQDEVGALLIRVRWTRPREVAWEGALLPVMVVLGRRRWMRPGEAARLRACSDRGASQERKETRVLGARRVVARGARGGTPEAFCGMDATELIRSSI